jgi:hypothetical protein
LAFAGVALGLFALVGLYVPQIQRTGVLGLLTFVVAMLGFAFSLGQLYGLTFTAPGTGPLGILFPLGYGPFLFGLILFDLVTIWAGLLPRIPTALLIVGAALNAAGFATPFVRLIGVVVFGVGAIWLGYALWSTSNTVIRQSQPQPATM